MMIAELTYVADQNHSSKGVGYYSTLNVCCRLGVYPQIPNEVGSYVLGFCLHSSETTYSAVLVRPQALDQMVQSDASANSSNYASAVMLSVRQAFGALKFTLSKNNDGSWKLKHR